VFPTRRERGFSADRRNLLKVFWARSSRERFSCGEGFRREREREREREIGWHDPAKIPSREGLSGEKNKRERRRERERERRDWGEDICCFEFVFLLIS
jgi:hypothetical protein